MCVTLRITKHLTGKFYEGPEKHHEYLKSMRKLDGSFTYFLIIEVGLKHDSSALKDVRILFVDGAHAF